MVIVEQRHLIIAGMWLGELFFNVNHQLLGSVAFCMPCSIYCCIMQREVSSVLCLPAH